MASESAVGAEDPLRDRLRTGMCADEPQGCDFRRVPQGVLGTGGTLAPPPKRVAEQADVEQLAHRHLRHRAADREDRDGSVEEQLARRALGGACNREEGADLEATLPRVAQSLLVRVRD